MPGFRPDPLRPRCVTAPAAGSVSTWSSSSSATSMISPSSRRSRRVGCWQYEALPPISIPPTGRRPSPLEDALDLGRPAPVADADELGHAESGSGGILRLRRGRDHHAGPASRRAGARFHGGPHRDDLRSRSLRHITRRFQGERSS